jgi:selenide,water dikinase
VLSTALKRDVASARNVADAVEVMTTLNASARDAALAVGVHAATDVTGFGLLGHMLEMVTASGVGAEVDATAVPIIDGVRDLLSAGMVAGGTQRNHAFVSDSVDWGDLALDDQLLLADAQTSGGLLLSVAPELTDALVAALRERDTLAAAVVGHATASQTGRIRVTE